MAFCRGPRGGGRWLRSAAQLSPEDIAHHSEDGRHHEAVIIGDHDDQPSQGVGATDQPVDDLARPATIQEPVQESFDAQEESLNARRDAHNTRTDQGVAHAEGATQAVSLTADGGADRRPTAHPSAR